jgi:hypothetical protein
MVANLTIVIDLQNRKIIAVIECRLQRFHYHPVVSSHTIAYATTHAPSILPRTTVKKIYDGDSD